MADDLSLLLKIRGDSAGAKAAIAETRAAVASLRGSFGSELAQMNNASNATVDALSNNLNTFVSRHAPLGGIFVNVTEGLKTFAAQSQQSTPALNAFSKSVEDLSKTTGKSQAEIVKFLDSFVRLPAAADRAAEGYARFGSKFDQLRPKLEQAGGQLIAVAAETETASLSMAGSITTSMASVVAAMGPVGVAAAGIAIEVAALAAGFGIVVTAAESLTSTLFGLARSAAELRGKMFDLSQQTGVSVETLSALDVMAQTTGGSIDSIAQSLVLFQTKLDEAQDASSKTGEKFRELGISTKDTETALRDALTVLSKMPEGFNQTNEATELFGRRGGKQMLAILKEMGGDLDGTIRKLREMGILMETEDSRAADEFNDKLRLLQLQFKTMLGNEGIPAAIAALDQFQKFLNDNRASINLFADAVGVASYVVGTTFKGALMGIQGGILLIKPQIDGLTNTFRLLSAAISSIDPNAIAAIKVPDLTPVARPINQGAADLSDLSSGIFRKAVPRGGGGGRVKPQDTFLQDALAEARLFEQEQAQIIAENVSENKRALDEQARDIEAFTKRAIQLADERLNATIDRINKDIQANETALAKKLINQAEFNRRDRELTLETSIAVEANRVEEFRLIQERDRKIAEAQLASNARTVQIAEDADRRTIDRIKNRIADEVIAESEGLRQIAEIIAEGFARRRKALEDEEASYATTLERRRAINDELIRLDGERAGAAEDAARRIAQALADEKAAVAARLAGGVGAGTAEVAPLEIEGPTSAIEQLFNAINTNLTGDTQTAALAGLQAMTLGFAELGQAVGQAAAAWVLYGDSGTSVRKVTAEVLASIAQMAATKAIYHLAEGFAALALAFFGIPNAGLSASAHFKAAAIFGTVAGIAAVAGRAVAGNSFSQTGGGQGSGNSTTQAAPARPEPRTIEQDRRQPTQPAPPAPIVFKPEIHLQLSGDLSQFDTRVERAVVRGVNNNSRPLQTAITRARGDN